MIDATTHGLSEHAGFLNASSMGTGKTRASAAFCHQNDVIPLVVCPKTLCSSWRDEFALWDMEPQVVNYERIRGKGLPEGELVIWDEAQALSGLDSLQSRLLVESVQRGSLNLLVSATLGDNPLKLKAPGYALGLHKYTDFWRWARANGCQPGYWGGMEFSGKDTYIRGLHYKIFPDRGVRLHYEDIPEFPSCQVTPELIDFSGNLGKVYDEMGHDLDQIPEIGDEDPAIVVQMRARQKTELLKVPDLCAMTKGLVEEGYSVCLFVNFLDTVHALAERMPESAVFTGENTGTRHSEIELFNQNHLHVAILSLAAGGPGLNLGDVLGERQRISLINPGFRAEHVIQACGRTHRGNAKSPALVRILFAKDTVEEGVWRNVKAKIRRIELLNDGDFTLV